MTPRFSYLDGLVCPECGDEPRADRIQGVCASCGSPLLARYDLDALRSDVAREDLVGRTGGLWRYHELLPVTDPASVVSFGEGMTPLWAASAWGSEAGIPGVLVKDESLLPTGTFKARGAAVGVSRAKELGVRAIAMPTNGNAGAAWAAYATRAGLSSFVAMPASAPLVTRDECRLAGAELLVVDGLIGDAGRIVSERVAATDETDVSTLKEPYRIEGKKTMALEIAEQLGWRMPDVVVYPTGGGVGLIGMHKAFSELRELGWVEGELPRFVAAQSTGCAPIVKAFESGSEVSAPWPDARTVAFGITVPKALGDRIILRALRETGGTAVAVEDGDAIAEVSRIARAEGAAVCPEGAVAAVAARRLREDGWIRESETVVVVNTGSGLKYPDVLAAA